MSAGEPPAHPVTAERKLVSVLFCDLVGSTELGARLEPETFQTVQSAYFDRTRSVIEGFGGTVEKFIGDAVVAVFGVPTAHEDDAQRAVRCALAIRDGLEGLNDTLRTKFGVELAVRIGVNSGEAMISGRKGDAVLASGDVMNTAARLEQAAGPGEVLVGRETFQLSRGAVDYEPRRTIEAKGKPGPVEAWVPVTVSSSPRRVRPPMVGRTAELASLAAALEGAIRSRQPRAVLVVGEPGIGKSRLAEEFAARVTGRAVVCRGTCLPYGEGTTWLPLAEVIRQGAGILKPDAPAEILRKLEEVLAGHHPDQETAVIRAHLGALVGATGGTLGSGSDFVWSVRGFVEALSATTPVVLILDDFQWAGDTLMETVVELIGTLGDAAVVWCCLGRPELLERMAEVLGGEDATVLRLGQLGHDEAMSLVGHLGAALGEGRVDGVRHEVVERAGGNPLFLEELAAMAAEEGSTSEAVPGTLRALIAARLDLLPPGAKRVAQAAAVVGDVFWDGALAAILEGGWEAAGTASALRALRSRGLVEEGRTARFVGQRQFHFHHGLVREVAYASVSKQDRAEMHRRAAGWLEPEAERDPGLQNLRANHLDQALALSAEVAPMEAPDAALAQAAVEALAAAGEWTASTGALPEAIALLRRAAEAAAAAPALRPLCLARLASTLALAGHVEEAVGTANEVLRTETSGEAAALASLALAAAGLARSDAIGMRTNGRRAVELSGGRFPVVEAQALDVVATAEFWFGENEEAERLWGLAAELAATGANLPLAARAIAFRSLSATLRFNLAAGARDAERALDTAERSGSLRALVAAHTALARLREFQDRLDEAVEHGREWFRLALEAGEPVEAHAGVVFGLASPLLHQGKLEEAWEALEQGMEVAGTSGVVAYMGNIRLERARCLIGLGRLEEADLEIGELRNLDTSDPEQDVFAAWASALLEAASGRLAESERLWWEAAGLISDLFESVSLACDFHLDLAAFLVDRGRTEAAAEQLAQIRRVVAGSGAGLYERLLAELESRL